MELSVLLYTFVYSLEYFAVFLNFFNFLPFACRWKNCLCTWSSYAWSIRWRIVRMEILVLARSSENLFLCTPSWMDIFTSTDRYRCAWIAFRDATSSIMHSHCSLAFLCFSLFTFSCLSFFFFFGTLLNFELVLDVLFRDSLCTNIKRKKKSIAYVKCLIWRNRG